MKRKKIFVALKLLVSILIFYLIFIRINIVEFLDIFKKINIELIIAGWFVGVVLQLLLGCFRWYNSLKNSFGEKISFWVLLKIFWEGMFVGYFMPASIGWDVYRVVEGRSINISGYKNVIIIIWEKVFGLMACFLLFFVSFPFFRSDITDSLVRSNMSKIWLLGLVVTLILFFIVSLSYNFTTFRNAIYKGVSFFQSLILNTYLKLQNKTLQYTERKRVLNEIFDIINLQGLSFFAISIAIKILPALSKIIYFYAIGVNVSFAVSVFATALILIIHILPISFGSLGIREGTHIIIFGLFGVLPEEALTVSFIGLFSLIFTILLGGGSILFSNLKSIATQRVKK